MNELDRLVRGVAPVGDEHVAALDLRRAELELLEEIMSTPTIAVVHRPSPRWRPIAVAAALVAAGVLAVALIGGSGTRPEYADAAVRVAQANSRLLIGEPGWTITEAEEFEVNTGEVTFANGKRRFEVHWYPAGQYRSYLDDRGVDARQAKLTVLGRPGTRFTYRALGISDIATVLPPQGGNFTELRGDGMSVRRYMRVLRSLKTVGVNTWLAAMPAIIVRPGDRAAIVDDMLAGVPIPKGVDVEALRSGGVHSTHQLVAEVTAPIACGWLDQWIAAKRSGDTVAAREAVRAMQTARDWPAFEGQERSGWPKIIWGYADAMKANADVGNYRQSLGCR